ncbi:MAG: metallophosphoesterase family protein [Pseudomonadota bacterium]
MSLLLHLSDPHFGTEQAPVVRALLELGQRLRPHVVVCSGDLTQRARERQFAAARRMWDALPARHRLAIPGNHDIPLFNLPARLLAPYGGFSRYFGPDLQPVHACPHWLVLCLRTTRRLRHKDGEVSSRQIDAVARRLRDALPGQVRVVVTHQPVLAIRDSDRRNLLHGHEAAVRAWVAAGADLLLGGHIHLPYVRDLRERHPDLPRPAWVVQAGTAVSRRLREGQPNSVNLLRRVDDGGRLRCEVQRLDFDARSGRFLPAAAQWLDLDR